MGSEGDAEGAVSAGEPRRSTAEFELVVQMPFEPTGFK